MEKFISSNKCYWKSGNKFHCMECCCVGWRRNQRLRDKTGFLLRYQDLVWVKNKTENFSKNIQNFLGSLVETYPNKIILVRNLFLLLPVSSTNRFQSYQYTLPKLLDNTTNMKIVHNRGYPCYRKTIHSTYTFMDKGLQSCYNSSILTMNCNKSTAITDCRQCIFSIN